MISVKGLSKTYKGGFQALEDIHLEIERGEIFALLGPNGAGKTTLINIICGLSMLTEGQVKVGGKDIVKDYRHTRSMVGLVPQELTTAAFETVWNTVNFTRGLFGQPPNPDYLEKILKELSLWDKKDNRLLTLSGGMKRRVMIAKALSHEPKVLFLDEPTAGVDVELRRDMWKQVHGLRESGVTIILTTHYIEEAEEMADRVGVINHGRIILTEEKNKLMKKLGSKRLHIELQDEIDGVPESLKDFDLTLKGRDLIYSYDSTKEDTGICDLLNRLSGMGLRYSDLHSEQSSLEEIFVELVRKK